MLIAVDTGGTKTLVASFSAAGVLEESRKFPTPTDTSQYISQLASTIHSIAGPSAIDTIVIALPGIVKNGVALWCNHLGWKNFDVRVALEKLFPNIPLLVENDANLAGLAEARSLSPVPGSSLYVTISTGIGTGMITGGVIDPGLRLSEGGRIMIEFDGLVREWESFASGSAIHATYNRFARDITDNSTWNQIADRISRGLLVLIPMIQPDIIIIGGSIGTYFERYNDQLAALLAEKLPAHISAPLCIQAAHPEEAVVYGCYYYALDSLTRK
ncbi:putative fructokinase [compost metagenome]